MNRRLTIIAITVLVIGAVVSVVLMAPAPANAGGAEQIRGTALPASEGQCTERADVMPEGFDFLPIVVPPLFFPEEGTGLHGCFYSYVLRYDDSPSGTYREWGVDVFVDNDTGDKFETTYLFTAKFDDEGEVWGRCQHPITAGSETAEGGIYEGVTGRIDIKDDVENGTFPYKGHLRW